MSLQAIVASIILHVRSEPEGYRIFTIGWQICLFKFEKKHVSPSTDPSSQSRCARSS